MKCISGTLYLRISVHVYNELSDYERLAKAVHAVTQMEPVSDPVGMVCSKSSGCS